MAPLKATGHAPTVDGHAEDPAPTRFSGGPWPDSTGILVLGDVPVRVEVGEAALGRPECSRKRAGWVKVLWDEGVAGLRRRAVHLLARLAARACHGDRGDESTVCREAALHPDPETGEARGGRGREGFGGAQQHGRRAAASASADQVARDDTS